MSERFSNHGKPGRKKTEVSLIRSSAAEYLTFVAASGQGGVEAIYADESIWLTQKMMGQLYDVETQTINYHLKKVFSDNELQESSVIRKFRITAADGKSYDTQHYHLSAITKQAALGHSWADCCRSGLPPCQCEQGPDGADLVEGCAAGQDSEI
jgi:hypothetical protein